MKKKFLACMLALTMCVGLTPVTSYAEESGSVVTENDSETTDENSDLTKDQTDEETALGMTEETTDVTTTEETDVTEDKEGEAPAADTDSSILTTTTADLSIDNAITVAKTEPTAEVVATVTIGEESQEFGTFEEAIAAANNTAGTDRVTVTIVKSGEYNSFNITRSNVTVEAAEGVDAVVSGLTNLDKDKHLCVITGLNVVIKGITFDISNLPEIHGIWINTNSPLEPADNNATIDSCTFLGSNAAGTGAIVYHGNKRAGAHFTMTNSVVENIENGLISWADNSLIKCFKFVGNTFKNVQYPLNGYWGIDYTGAEPNFVITGNTFDAGSFEKSFIALWDYSQYMNWSGNNEADRKGSALNVLIKDNIYIGNVVVELTHCNWFKETPINVDSETEERLIYRHLVELGDSDDIFNVEVLNADGTPLGHRVGDTASADKAGKKVIYALSEGEYIINIKIDENSDVISMPLTVKPQIPGETTNKIALTEDNKYVASIGDKKYTSIQDAIKNIKSGDTLELLNDIVVDKGLYFVSSDANKLSDITIKGNGHTVKASDAFQKNEYEQINLMKFDGVEGVKVEDITLVSSSASIHTLDTHKSTVTLKDVTLDHTNAKSGAPLIDNASDITVEGELNLLTGDSSWYGINVDNKNGAASLTFAEGASLTHTMSKEVVTIFKEETEGQPPVVIEGAENVGLLEKEDGSYVVHTHTLTVVEEVPATCTEDGMKKYYECSECKKYFADEAGDVEITDLESLVIPANGHQYDDRGKCTVCGVLTPDAEAANKVDALIDAIGSPDKVTLDSKAAIEAAVNAYNKLTDAQKKLVTGYEDLDKAVKVYNALLEAEEGKDPEKDPDKDKPIDKPDNGTDNADGEDKKPGTVQTGDTTNVAGYMTVMVLAAGIAVFAVIRRKRRG